MILTIIYLATTILGYTGSETPKLLREKDYLDFGVKVQDAVNSSNPKFFENSFYFSVVGKYLDSLKLSGTREKNYRKEAVSKYLNAMQVLIANVQNGGHFEMVGVYVDEIEKKGHVIFESYLNYVDFIDFELEAHGDAIYIVDFFSYYSGDYFSSSIFNHVRNELEHGNLGGMYVAAQRELYNVQGYEKRGQYEKAWQAFGRIPLEFQTQKTFCFVKLELSKYISEAAYLNTIENFIQSYPEDERFIALQLVNFFLTTSEGKSALEEITLLQNYVGESTLLKYLKGQAYYKIGDYKNALENYELAIEHVHSLYPAHVGKLTVLLRDKDYVSVLEQVDKMNEVFGIDSEEWDNFFELYPEFLQSEYYSKVKENLN